MSSFLFLWNLFIFGDFCRNSVSNRAAPPLSRNARYAENRLSNLRRFVRCDSRGLWSLFEECTMNYRYSWTDRTMRPRMGPFTCPHTNGHPTISMPQVQGSTPAHTRCTFRPSKVLQEIAGFFLGTFDSIEAILTAVNSIADMLNATHHAVYSSFQAVLGALDEFAKLKTQIHCLLASTALLNWLRYIWRLLLKCLRLRDNGDDGMEEVWTGVQKNLGAFATQETSSQLASSNPFRWLSSLMFWLIAISVPYLMYQSLGRTVDEAMKWTTGQDGYYEAFAIEDHNTEENDKISFKSGDVLHGKKVGLVPIKKIRLTKRVVELPVFSGHDAVQLFDDTHASENYLYD
uniref:Peroxin-13 n=1 Tax=Onchocerca volvulus TaxID=6282 RepID=A0A8R1TKU6_ONCVO